MPSRFSGLRRAAVIVASATMLAVCAAPLPARAAGLDGLGADCLGRDVFVSAPHLRAAEQGGQVAFQPIILQWDGQQWIVAAEYGAYVSAGDGATIFDQALQGDVSWYAIDTGQQAGGWRFTINQPGYFAVVAREWYTQGGQWVATNGELARHAIDSVYNPDWTNGDYCYIP